jgi:hypothetical protein
MFLSPDGDHDGVDPQEAAAPGAEIWTAHGRYDLES